VICDSRWPITRACVSCRGRPMRAGGARQQARGDGGGVGRAELRIDRACIDIAPACLPACVRARRACFCSLLFRDWMLLRFPSTHSHLHGGRTAGGRGGGENSAVVGGGQDDHDCNTSEDGRTHARPETAARAALLRSPTRCCSAPCRDGRPSESACPPVAVRGVFPLPAVVPVRRVRCAA